MTTLDTRAQGPRWGLIAMIGLAIAAAGFAVVVVTNGPTSGTGSVANPAQAVQEQVPSFSDLAPRTVPDQATIDLLAPVVTQEYLYGSSSVDTGPIGEVDGAGHGRILGSIPVGIRGPGDLELRPGRGDRDPVRCAQDGIFDECDGSGLWSFTDQAA